MSFDRRGFNGMDDYTKKALELFGESINLGIEERKTNVSELSRITGLSRTTIIAIRDGTKTYGIDSYIKLASALQIHIEFSMMSIDNNIHTMGGNKPNMN